MSGSFEFLAGEFPDVQAHAARAESSALSDARVSCFYARLAIETAVTWAFANDPALVPPYESNLSALLHDPTFKQSMPLTVFHMTKEVVRLGNRAAHESQPLGTRDAVIAVANLFEFLYWFGRTYLRGEKPAPGLRFDARALPKPAPAPLATAEEIRTLQVEAEQSEQARTRSLELQAANVELQAQIEALRAEVAAAKARAAEVPDTHDYSEAATRLYLIDVMLAEAGWTLTDERDTEFEVTGMPSESGIGFVDYVLWGDDGKPLAVVEAKNTRRSPQEGQHQAKLYADCLEQQFGQRPVIYYSNGYETWMWDDQLYPPREVQGFRTKDELELLIQRRSTRKVLTDVEINTAIVDRHYQERAIRRICELFEPNNERRALVVMATGAGKTRTVVALADLLIRANWAKRVLFLADRQELVKQAAATFTECLPDSAPVNLLKERDKEGRIYVSTYQTMVNLIDETDGHGRRRFGPGHFDLVVIDEAHRSVFRKYRAIFEYFDSLLVGLTATPKSEIARNTYDLFNLETGVPTDEYGLDAAVADGFLVPFQAMSVPLKFQREGIRYDELSEEEKDDWDELDWGGGDPPDGVGADAINKWLFNADTVDKVLAHVMTHGIKVEGGDRLAKTIIFAKSDQHAQFIGERFDKNYPQYRGEFARVVTYKTEKAGDLVDKFKLPDTDPQIAISVDMLDTGIDVPEVCNLVFFKIVRSKTKFWQMVGRGTRLCSNLFGPGQDKERFMIFDFCQNLEYFGQNPDASDAAAAPSLSARIFRARVDLIRSLDRTGQYRDDRDALAGLLRSTVGTMTHDNFTVRPHWRLVEQYRELAAWESLDENDLHALDTLSELPVDGEQASMEAKQFDLLMLNLELALINGSPEYSGLQAQVRAIASLLEGYANIPAIGHELTLIQEVQTDDWWVDVTLPMIEDVRRRLRLLVGLIERRRRAVLYSNFEDQIGVGVEIDLGGVVAGDYAQFRKKAAQYLRAHENHMAIQRLRRNQPITETDVEELERMLAEIGGDPESIERARVEAGSLGLFVRSLVGMDRAAAKEAFAEFLDAGRYRADQIDYVNMIIDHLASSGTIEARRFYESPFTDVSASGPDQLFESGDVDRLIAVVHEIQERAAVG